MSELSPVSPLLDGFTIGAPVKEHFGICCYPAIKANSDRKYILKVISIPASQSQLDALLYSGAYKDSAAASEYFFSIAREIEEETKFLLKMARLEGFLPFEGCQIEPMQRAILGYNVYLISGFRLSLERYMHRQTVTHLETVNLGIDLCSALAACRKQGMLYTALKPANIFISTKKEYKIGDLGFVPLSAMSYTPMPAKYRSCYTPPELLDDMAVLNGTVDTYAVGMILFQLFNGGLLPADVKSPLPDPCNADPQISEIIRKACDPDPKQRWSEPAEMRQALVDYMQGGVINAVPLMDPIPADTSSRSVIDTSRFQALQNQQKLQNESTPAEHQQDAPDVSFPTDSISGEIAVSDSLEQLIPKKKKRSKKEKNEAAVKAETASVAAEAVSETRIEPAGTPATEETPAAAQEETAIEVSEQDTSPAEEAAAEQAPAEETAPAEASAAEAAEPESSDCEMPQPEEDPEAIAQAIENAAASEFAAIAGEESILDEAHLDSELAELQKILRLESAAPKAPKKHPNIQPVVIQPEKKSKSPVRFLALLLVVCLIAAAGFWGYLFYKGEYLKVVRNMTVTGSLEEMIVEVDSDIADNLLNVSCTDTYGNSQRAHVRSGKATFQDLSPDTMYKIQLEISGVHKLVGPTTEIFTTESVTNVVSFTATVGQEDGSATLNLVVDGHEPEKWQVIYTAEGEPELGHTFTGHTTQINDLVLGKTYIFRLETGRHESVNGQTAVELRAAKLVTARDVSIVSCADGEMVVRWDSVGEAQDGWRVYCSGEGFDQVLECSSTEATFTGIEEGKAYTVEVKANGMSQASRISVSPNPITITDFRVDESNPLELLLSWDFTGIEPTNGWVVQYTLDGSNLPSAMKANSNSISIGPRVPGAVYHFTIQAAEETSVFNNTHNYQCPDPVGFSGHGLAVNSITNMLLPTPETGGWNYSNVPAAAFTNEFTVGQSVSMVMRTPYSSSLDNANVHMLYVYRDQNGNALAELISEEDVNWKDLWYQGDQRFAELNVPCSPFRAGSYTLSVYIDGMLATTATLSVK